MSSFFPAPILIWSVAVALAHTPQSTVEKSLELVRYDGGAITQAQFDHWSRFQETQAAERSREALEELALIQWLAKQADNLGQAGTMRNQVQAHWLWGEYALKLYWRQLYEETQVPPQAVENAYEQAKDRVHRPRRVRLRNLYKRFPPKATQSDKEAVKQHMANLRAQLEEGADFAKLALAESHSQTRFNQGYLGNVKQGTLRPEVDQIAMAMKPGELSPVIETEDGLTLLFCESIIPEVKRSVTTFKNNLENRLRQQAYESAKAATLEAATKRLVSTIDWDVLGQTNKSRDTNLITRGEGKVTAEEYLALLRYRSIKKYPNNLDFSNNSL